jgi:hypothetical protein
MPLSPQEQQRLAAIEKDLSKDPRLARSMTRTAPRPAGPRWLPLGRQHLATLAAALLALILVHAVGSEIHPAASAALTCGLVITWLVSAARPAAVKRPDDGEATPADPPGAAPKRARPRRKEE